jgi:uncharacterized protein (TIGR00369 family)
MTSEPSVADTAFLHETMPFTRLMGLELEESGPGRVVFRAPWRPVVCTSQGIMQGGFLMAAVDSAGALCAFNNLPESAAGTTTIESKTNFLGAVRAGSVTITAQPVHAGSTTIVVQTDATDDKGRLISRSIQTQAVLDPR